jgi:hypothetical protein
MTADLTELLTTGATTLVAAAATDVWGTARRSSACSAAAALNGRPPPRAGWTRWPARWNRRRPVVARTSDARNRPPG